MYMKSYSIGVKTMKKIITILCLCLVSFSLSAQTLGVYEKESKDEIINFLLGSIEDKVTLIKNSDIENNSGYIYVFALQFVHENWIYLDNVPVLQDLAYESVRRLKNPSAQNAVPLFKPLFESINNNQVRIAILDKIPELVQDSYELVSMINSFVFTEIQRLQENRSLDLIIAGLNALKKCGSSLSFDVYFSVLQKNISPEISSLAKEALFAITKESQIQLMNIVRYGKIEDRVLAFEIIQENPKNSEYFCAEVAENTLANVINISEESYKSDSAIELQLNAMRVLKKTSWTKASKLLIEYFGIAQKYYKSGKISTENMIEIISCLQHFASVESGQALASYLGSLNEEAEKTKQYNESLLLSVITALGELGEKSAFDYLLYAISFSEYSDAIISAAKDALAGLKW